MKRNILAMPMALISIAIIGVTLFFTTRHFYALESATDKSMEINWKEAYSLWTMGISAFSGEETHQDVWNKNLFTPSKELGWTIIANREQYKKNNNLGMVFACSKIEGERYFYIMTMDGKFYQIDFANGVVKQRK